MQDNFYPYLCRPKNKREFSSVGLEHLPYKQRVGGSTPSTPTKEGLTINCEAFLLMRFIVYIIYSSLLDKFYIGVTSMDVSERLRRHNCNHKGFTGKNADWQLLYTEHYPEKILALKREKEIKSWKSRKKIAMLIGL